MCATKLICSARLSESVPICSLWKSTAISYRMPTQQTYTLTHPQKQRTFHMYTVLNIASITRCAMSRYEQISRYRRNLYTHTEPACAVKHCDYVIYAKVWDRLSTPSRNSSRTCFILCLCEPFTCVCALSAECYYMRVVHIYSRWDSNGRISLAVCSFMGFIAPCICVKAYYLYCWGIALALNVTHTTSTPTTTTKTSSIYLYPPQ